MDRVEERAPDGAQYRRQLETVADNATLALFIMDERQHCTYMNPAAETLTGFTLAEVQGRPLHDVIHHTYPDGRPFPIEECAIDRAFPQNMREQGEEIFVRRDGSFYPVAYTASPIREAGRTVGTIIEVRDITGEVRAREDLLARDREAALAIAIGTALTEGGTLRILLQRCVEAVVEHLDAAFARIWTLNAAEQVLELQASAGLYTHLDGPHGRIPVGALKIGRIAEERRPHLSNDVQNDPRVSDVGWAQREGMIAFAGYPLLVEGRVVGVLGMFARRVLPQRTLHALSAVADSVAAAIVRKRAEEERERLLHELEAQAGELRYQAGQLEEMQIELEMANEALQRSNQDLEEGRAEAERARADAEATSALLDALFEAAPVAAGFLDPELRYRRVNGTLAAIDGMEPSAMIGRTLHEVIPHAAARVEPFYRKVLETGEPVNNVEVSLPRTEDPSSIGHYLVNYFPVADGDGGVAGVGLVALDVTEQKEAEEGRREEARIVETLHRIGQSLASGLEVDRVVQDVTDAATTLTGADFGAFFYNVVREDGEAYTLYTISGVPREAFSKFPMPRSTPVFEPTFHGTGIVRSEDITRDPRYGRMPPYHGMPPGHLPVRSYLAVPVISRSGKVLGGLFFGHPEPGRFLERHERLAVGIAGWAAVAMDNAHLFTAEHRARAEAERANRAKSDFLATMSHELRTPLNAMIGYTDLLLAGIPESIPDQAAQKVERIGISARHLLQLIEEILTFSRLEAGEERVESQAVDMGELLGEVQALIEPLALAKQIGFETRAPERGLQVESDARKIRQILLNLLGNAVKFTEEGAVGLAVEAAGPEVVFRVTDTGPGIPSEHLDRIFEPFWQVEGGATRTKEGTGLGLSVSRRLARLLGGEVHVASEPGSGSTFTVRLPRHAPTPG